MKLLSTANTKIQKSKKYNVMTYILHLAPANLSGHEVCPKASLGCKLACLNTAGMGKFSNVQSARIEKTKLFFQNRELFMETLVKEIKSAIKKANKEGMELSIRLNGTSDLNFVKFRVVKDKIDYRNLFEAFPEVQFYDYSKRVISDTIPENYHLTFSRSESNDKEVEIMIKKGFNIAVVFDKLPETYLGLPVISGDDSDIRYKDPKGVIVGLVAKGKAKHDDSGFVVKV